MSPSRKGTGQALENEGRFEASKFIFIKLALNYEAFFDCNGNRKFQSLLFGPIPRPLPYQSKSQTDKEGELKVPPCSAEVWRNREGVRVGPSGWNDFSNLK